MSDVGTWSHAVWQCDYKSAEHRVYLAEELVEQTAVLKARLCLEPEPYAGSPRACAASGPERSLTG